MDWNDRLRDAVRAYAASHGRGHGATTMGMKVGIDPASMVRFLRGDTGVKFDRGVKLALLVGMSFDPNGK